MCEGWNMTTRRAETGIISPVFGLRPGRLFLLRRQKTPKPESFTVSPCSSSVEISSKNAITISAASRLFTPRFSWSRVARSAFVMVIEVLRGAGRTGVAFLILLQAAARKQVLRLRWRDAFGNRDPRA